MSADIDFEELRQIAAIVAAVPPAVEASAIAIAEAARDRIAPYPGVRRQRMRFQSPKQRRGFFAKLRSGAITVPYRRSGDTLGRWGQPERISSGARLRNTAPHAKWVHSKTDQAAYHRGNWKTDAGVADQLMSSGVAAQIVEDAITHALAHA